MKLDNEQTFPCEQAALEVTFEWNVKTIPSGMDAEHFQKIGKWKCSGSRSEKCPVHIKNEPPALHKCNFYRSLVGKPPA